jgi:predicted PurR-regulated permease PerM
MVLVALGMLIVAIVVLGFKGPVAVAAVFLGLMVVCGIIAVVLAGRASSSTRALLRDQQDELQQKQDELRRPTQDAPWLRPPGQGPQ